MDKIKELFKSLVEKWKSLSKGRKISLILIVTGVLLGVILLTNYIQRSSYSTLFYNLDSTDASKIIEKLKNENIQYKVEGNSILVPRGKVDELRMEVALDTSYQNKGYEIYDQSKFGITDSEARMMNKIALEGEIARAIQSLDEIKNAKVILVMPEETVFARETEKATASVIIKPEGMKTLSPEQVKAIIYLVKGSVKNLSESDVAVLDTYGNLLSENIFDNQIGGSISTLKQHEYEKKFEDKLQKDVKEMLESVFGQGKVVIKVNSDLNFDSKQITTIKYDKDDVVERSKRIIYDLSKDSSGTDGKTGVDGQFGDDTYPTNDGSSNSTYEKKDETINHEIGQTEEHIVKAPGEVTRMTVSVIINSELGKLSDVEKEEIRNIVASAVGYDENRGDNINISALPFNTERQDQYKKEMDELEKKKAKEELIKLIETIVAGIFGFIILLFIILKIRKSRNNSKGMDNKTSIDVVVGNGPNPNIIPKQPVIYEPLLVEDESDMNLEKEIQNYATKKPEQVIEVVKTWLSDDESR